MDETFVSPLDSVVLRRRWCGGLWAAVLAMGIGGLVNHVGQLVLLAWVASVLMMIGTAATAGVTKDERLVHPGPYRLLAGALLAVALAGCVLGMLPEASEISRVFTVFFGTVAFLSYRSLVARGPRCAVASAALALWAWLPFVAVTLIGHHPHRGYIRVPHWTETASVAALASALFLAVALNVAALLAFRPRTDAMPDARVV